MVKFPLWNKSPFNTILNHLKIKNFKIKGFSLIELILYVGLASLVLTGVLRSGWEVIQANQTVQAKNEIQQNARLAFTRLGSLLRSADSVFDSGPSGSGEITLTPTGDTWINQASSSQNNGNSSSLHVYPWASSRNQRSLIRFNLASIPQGATVTSALLRLRESGTYGVSRTIGAHRITSDWVEGTGASGSGATWARRNGSTNWNTAGGDFVSAATAAILVNWSPYEFPKTDEWNVISDVQNFVSGSASNYGWLIKDSNEDSSQNYWFFSSREGATRPELFVQYQQVGSLFDAHPGILTLDFPGENTNVVIDTYSKNLTLAGQSVTIRKLRLTQGASSYDLTSDRVNVAEFIVRNRTQSGNLQTIHFNLTIQAVSDPDASFDFSSSLSLRH